MWRASGNADWQKQTHGTARSLAEQPEHSAWWTNDRVLQQISGGILGTSTYMFFPRLFVLYAVILPFFVMRLVLSLVFFVTTVGVVTSFLLIGSGPAAVYTQNYYRPVLEWAQVRMRVVLRL